MIKQKKSWWILFIVSIGVMIPFIFPYLTLDPTKSRAEISPETFQYPILVAHIFFAFIALVTGFLQFIDHIRLDNPKIHRNIGITYVLSVFISDLLAFADIYYKEDFAKAMPLLVLAILWLFTTWKGYSKAVKKQFNEHRIWMIRSFGVTLMAVSARVLVPVLFLCYFILNDFTITGGKEQVIQELRTVNIWAAIVFNIVIVEWVILSRKSEKK